MTDNTTKSGIIVELARLVTEYDLGAISGHQKDKYCNFEIRINGEAVFKISGWQKGCGHPRERGEVEDEALRGFRKLREGLLAAIECGDVHFCSNTYEEREVPTKKEWVKK